VQNLTQESLLTFVTVEFFDASKVLVLETSRRCMGASPPNRVLSPGLFCGFMAPSAVSDAKASHVYGGMS
jgi:hypothetical protein